MGPNIVPPSQGGGIVLLNGAQQVNIQLEQMGFQTPDGEMQIAVPVPTTKQEIYWHLIAKLLVFILMELIRARVERMSKLQSAIQDIKTDAQKLQARLAPERPEHVVSVGSKEPAAANQTTLAAARARRDASKKDSGK